MNICKSGGISARTKSLREKFSSKRSFSELSFAAPSTSTSSLAASETSCKTRSGSFRSPRSTRRSQRHHHEASPSTGGSPVHHHPGSAYRTAALAASSKSARDKEIANEIIRVATGSSSEYTCYLPEDAYSSALDINCQMDDEPRFPWQRDAATQCDILIPASSGHGLGSGVAPQILVDHESPIAKKSFGAKTVERVANLLDTHVHHHHHHHHGSKSSPQSGGVSPITAPITGLPVHPAAAHLLLSPQPPHASSTSALPTSSPDQNIAPQVTHKKSSHFSGLRFWKSSHTLSPEEQQLQQQLQQQQQQQTQGKASRRMHKLSYNSYMNTKTSGGSGGGKKSVLQRAVSFDSRGAGKYSKLVSNDSLTSIAMAEGIVAAAAANNQQQQSMTLHHHPPATTTTTSTGLSPGEHLCLPASLSPDPLLTPVLHPTPTTPDPQALLPDSSITTPPVLGTCGNFAFPSQGISHSRS